MLIKKIAKDERIMIAKIYTEYRYVLNIIIFDFCKIIIIVLKIDVDIIAKI
jgi:hypothetical protein